MTNRRSPNSSVISASVSVSRASTSSCGFLGDLGQNLVGRGPVEADAGGAFLQLHRAGQGGQAHGDAVQGAGGTALGGLQPFPVGGLLVGRLVAAFGAEDMGVAGQHLVGDGR